MYALEIMLDDETQSLDVQNLLKDLREIRVELAQAACLLKLRPSLLPTEASLEHQMEMAMASAST